MRGGVDAVLASLIKPRLGRAFVSQNPIYICWIPFYLIGLFLLRGLSSFVSIFGMAWVARRVVKDMRGRVFNKLLDLPSRFYDRVNSSALVSRLTYYVEQIAEATTTVLTSKIGRESGRERVWQDV